MVWHSRTAQYANDSARLLVEKRRCLNPECVSKSFRFGCYRMDISIIGGLTRQPPDGRLGLTSSCEHYHEDCMNSNVPNQDISIADKTSLQVIVWLPVSQSHQSTNARCIGQEVQKDSMLNASGNWRREYCSYRTLTTNIQYQAHILMSRYRKSNPEDLLQSMQKQHLIE